jgi:hypothetical protein
MSLLLYKTFNDEISETEWLSLNFDQIIAGRQSVFIVMKTNNHHVGLNIINNGFHALNGLSCCNS